MFVRANFVDIYLQGMRDRSMRSGTELARETKLTDWSMAGNLSNRSSGVQIPRDICTRLKRYLYSAKSSWIIRGEISPSVTDVSLPSLNENNLNNLQIRSHFGVFFVFHKVKSIEKYKQRQNKRKTEKQEPKKNREKLTSRGFV